MPRVLVSLLLSLTALAGFLTSVLLLRAGVSWMWLRYPVAILFAYLTFLMLLALWLRVRRHGPDIDLSGFDWVPSGPSGSGGGGSSPFEGGADFHGGGAGGSWTQASSSSTPALPCSDSSPSSEPSFGLSLDLEEGWLLVLAIVAIIGGLIASLYVVYIAPVLLAEILVDGVLVAGLYKRVKRIEQRHWLRAAVRRTILPALLVALFFAVAGYALQSAVPEARKMGDVWREVRE